MCCLFKEEIKKIIPGFVKCLQPSRLYRLKKLTKNKKGNIHKVYLIIIFR